VEYGPGQPSPKSPWTIRWLRSTRHLPLATFVGVLLLCILLPIVIDIIMSLLSAPFGEQAQVTGEQYVGALASRQGLGLLLNTLLLTLGAGLGGTVIGGLLAWIVTSVDIPFRRIAFFLPLLPLLIPPLMKDTAWILLYSPRTGLVNIGLKDVFGTHNGPFNIFSMWGMIADIALSGAPIAYIFLLTPLSNIDRSLDEASRIVGAGRLYTLRRVTAPVVAPALLSALALSCLLTATAFETPVLLGLPANVRVYMSAIFDSISVTAPPNYNLAAAQSVVYLAVGAVLFAWYMRVTRNERKFAVLTGRGHGRSRVRVRPWVAALLLAFILVYFLFSFLQLFVTSVLVSLVPFYTVTGGNPFRVLTGQAYANVLGQSSLISPILTSVLLSTIVSVVATAAAVVLALVSLKSRLRIGRLIEVIATLPIAIPALVFSMALLLSVLFVPGLSTVYNTPVPLIVAMVIAFLPFAVRVVSAAMVQLGDDLLEISRVSGAGRLRSILTIVIPLLWGALGLSAMLVFAESFRELGAVILLVPPDLKMLPTQIFSYWQTGEVTQVAVLNIISIVIPLAVAAVALSIARLAQWEKRVRQRRQWAAVPAAPHRATAAVR
jgi:iron(III) transport system permease protein